MSQTTDILLLLKRARLLLEEGRTAAAFAVLEAIQAADEQQQKELDYLLGWGNLQARQWSEAARLLAPFDLFNERDREVETLNNRELQALCLLKLGGIAIQAARNEEAGRHLVKALKVLQDHRVQLPNAQIKAHYYLATSYKMRGLFSAAIQEYLRARELCISLDESRELPFIYDGLAETYRTSGAFIDAYESGKKALVLYRRASNREGECTILNRLGRIALKLGDFPNAVDYYTESLATAAIFPDQQGDKMVMINCAALADLRLEEGRIDEARRYCERVTEISHRSDNKFLAGMADVIVGKVTYAEAQQVEGAERRRKMEEAISWFAQAAEALGESEAYDLLAEVNGRWAEVLEDLGQSQEALGRWKSAFAARAAAKGPSWEEI